MFMDISTVRANENPEGREAEYAEGTVYPKT